KPHIPSPSSTETLAEPRLGTAISGLPSLLKSPTPTERGSVPTGKLVAVPKLPLPSPSRIDTLSELMFAVARSGLPSLLKSPTATKIGYVPTGKLVAVPKPPAPSPSSTETLLAAVPAFDV